MSAAATETFDPTTPVRRRHLPFEDSEGRGWSFAHGTWRQWYRETGRDVARKRGDVLVDEPQMERIDADWVAEDGDRVAFMVEELSGAYAKIAELQAYIRGFTSVRP